ncbi:hypothetical protein ACO0R3_000017 [Hanseniaspora guilliermondii]
MENNKYQLPLSNFNSNDSYLTMLKDNEDHDHLSDDDLIDNPYVISVNNNFIDTPNNTPNEISLNNYKINSLARITSVNSGSYIPSEDIRSMTPLSNQTSSGNTSRQVSNANLKKMMLMNAHNKTSNLSLSSLNKYKVHDPSLADKNSYADLMSLNTTIPNKTKFQLHLVTSRDEDDEDDFYFSNNISKITPQLNNSTLMDHHSDTNSNFSMVSSLEQPSPLLKNNDFQKIKPNLGRKYKIKKHYKYIFILSGLPASGKSTLSQNMIQFMTQKYLRGEYSKSILNGDSLINHDSVPRESSTCRSPSSGGTLEVDRHDNNCINTKLKIEIFNAGKIRRSDSYTKTRQMYMMANNSNEDLFSPKNKSKKDVFAKLTLNSLFKNLTNSENDLDMAIFDATNSTRERRKFVVEEIYRQEQALLKNFQTMKNLLDEDDEDTVLEKLEIIPVFLQIMCTNRDFITYNIYNKSFNDDYFDKPFDFAIKDFSKRVIYYSQEYCPITHEEIDELMHHSMKGNKLFFINLENSKNSSYQTNINNEDLKQDVILNGLIDFAKSYNQLPESISYVNKVESFYTNKSIQSSDNVKVLKQFLNNEYFEKLNRNLRKTCKEFGIDVPSVK